MKTKWAILILILAGFIAYGNTLKNGLFWDDDEFITRNAYIRSFRYLPQWFSQPLTAGAGVNSNYYRPLLQLSFAIDYKLWGLWPAGYHVENLIWHSLAGILLFVFLNNLLPQIFNFPARNATHGVAGGQFFRRSRILLRRTILNQFSKLKRITINNQQSAIIAFTTSLLWLIHPVHVEAVAYANSRGDSMATVFILLSLILWMPPYRWSPIRVKKRFWGSSAAFVLALLSKEFAIVTPGLMALISFVNLKETPRRTSRSLLIMFIMFIIAAIYILLRLTVLNFQNTLNFYGADLSTNKNCDVQPQQRFDLCLYSTSIFIRSLTLLKILPIYFKLLVWPANLHMERTIDIPTTFLDSSILLSLSFILMLVGFFGWALIFSMRKLAGTSEPRSHALREREAGSLRHEVSVLPGSILVLAIGWFFISILPVSGLIPISQILAEHFLYLPSIGFFLMVSWLMVLGLNQVSRFLTIKRLNDSNHLTFTYLIYWTILLIISIPLISKTIRQNHIWRDPIIFYEYTLVHAQPTARVYNNLAMAYADAKNHNKAIDNYQKSIALGDVYPNPHYNLGNTYVEIGETEKAEEEYKKALKIDPNFHYATLKLGQIFIDQGKIDEAKKLVCPVFPTQPLCL